jgi:hypothetical protein
MDLGYLGFMNDVDMKKERIPQPRTTWVSFPGKNKAIKGDNKKLSIGSKQILFTITKEIKNNLG